MSDLCDNIQELLFEKDEISSEYYGLNIDIPYSTLNDACEKLREMKVFSLAKGLKAKVIRCQISRKYNALVVICECDDYPFFYKVILVRIVHGHLVYHMVNNSRDRDFNLAIKHYNRVGGDFNAPLEESEIDVTNCIF